MCVRCGIGSIREGIRVYGWEKGKPFTRYIPCVCSEGVRLRKILQTANLLTDRTLLQFTKEEALKVNHERT